MCMCVCSRTDSTMCVCVYVAGLIHLTILCVYVAGLIHQTILCVCSRTDSSDYTMCVYVA